MSYISQSLTFNENKIIFTEADTEFEVNDGLGRSSNVSFSSLYM